MSENQREDLGLGLKLSLILGLKSVKVRIRFKLKINFVNKFRLQIWKLLKGFIFSPIDWLVLSLSKHLPLEILRSPRDLYRFVAKQQRKTI